MLPIGRMLIVLIGALKEVCEGGRLKVQDLRIVPPAVPEGGKVLLQCLYDLEGEALYCIKWYRGSVEFYRYCPSDWPATKTYSFTLFNVDLQNSNATQVVLQDVRSQLSGVIKCEVSADAPTFATGSASSHMEVVRMPHGGPVIVSELPAYEAGDILRANCTVPPSSPPSNITLFINNEKISPASVGYKEVDKGLYRSHLSVTVPLVEAHFGRGRPVIKCLAEVFDLYSGTAELIVESRKGPPKLERVTHGGEAALGADAALLFLCAAVAAA